MMVIMMVLLFIIYLICIQSHLSFIQTPFFVFSLTYRAGGHRAGNTAMQQIWK